ncbi:MAG: RNA-binding protein [Trueperaceae bacterium]|jgi:predicted RNA-binding protein YlqC (UPF0109 family)|nr:RNA-binding protein [Trueperaceae bacterium]MCH2666493.1 KH domain-containing protein [Deinococcales bacterium]|tara:strand:+ start:15100 stop:15330 length:231 start_codon:yes stop_codon:yes gene_type:complete
MSLELVTYIISNLVDEPDQLNIKAEQEEDSLQIHITCAPNDAGRIIGRGGRIINSIRTLARASSDGRQRVEVQLID